jgi:hypothetical protein
LKLHTFVRAVAFAAALACSAKSANAAPIVFSDVTAFRAAAGSTSVLTFDDLPPSTVSPCLPASPYIPDPCEFHYGGAVFVATEGSQSSVPLFNQRPRLIVGTIGQQTSNGLLSGSAIPNDSDDFFFTFDGNAVGFSVWSFGISVPVRIKVEDVNGQALDYLMTVHNFQAQFFGVVSPVALTKVRLYSDPSSTNGNWQFSIDDVELQDVDLQPVPEPSTLALMLGGFVVVARRRLGSKP